MVDSGDKTRFLVIGTPVNRFNKILKDGKVMEVVVVNNIKIESANKKLLGIVVNNIRIKRNHLEGYNRSRWLLHLLSK